MEQSVSKAVGACRIMIVVFTEYAGRSDRIELQVATLVGEPPRGAGHIGLYGESAETSQNVWDFTNVTVTGIR
jgi:hypothetical protein